MKTPVIIDAIRTPIGALGGILASVRPDDMAAHVIKAILERNQFDSALVEEVFFGCAKAKIIAMWRVWRRAWRSMRNLPYNRCLETIHVQPCQLHLQADR